MKRRNTKNNKPPSNETAKMAASSSTKDSKGKKGKEKDGDKKSSKKVDEVSQPAEEEIPPATEAEEVVEEEITEQVEPINKEEELTPPPLIENYDGPILTDVIIESFEGEKVKGLFEGEGFMQFVDGHTYQGQFSHGLMHGFGCYKWIDGVTYEGDFDQNHITGKGLYTYPDGSTYEGEVFKGKRHGYGTYKFKDNTMSYTGQWFMGRKHGKGHMQFDTEGISFYEGDWVDDLFHGWGKRRYPNRNEYHGMWYNNQRHIDGSMKWFSQENSKCSELYNGQWHEGIQYGFGEHIWITYRLPGTQFNSRNSYIGQFKNGMKHGKGIFHYADGAKYDGEWFEDMKHGKAIFTQRTGEVHEGTFENNHLPINVAVFGLPGLFSGKESPANNHENSVTERNFLLDINELLKDYPELDRKIELEQISKNVWRHIASLKGIYGFYSRIGCEESADNVYIMSNLQYWRFLKDCHFHHEDFTLTQMNRFIGKFKSSSKLDNPFIKILQREFIANLIILSFHLYHKQYIPASERFKQPRCMLDWCFSQMLKNKVFPFACQVKGYFYAELRKALNVFEHIDKVYQLFKSYCEQQKYSSSDRSFRMRDFLFLLKDINLINDDLSIGAIIKILSVDDPNVIKYGCYNLELEMTFLEFIEALIGCSEVYVTESIVESVSSYRAISSCELGQHGQQRTSVSGVESSINLVTSTNLTSAPAAAAAAPPTEVGSVTLAGAPPKSTPSITSPPQPLPTTTSTPVVVNSELSLLGNVHLVESDTKIIDITKQPEVHVSLSRDELTTDKDIPVDEDGEDHSSEDLDHATKKYNFWTHQIHIFFIQKFIGPAQKLLELRYTARQKANEEIKQAKILDRRASFMIENWMRMAKYTPTTDTTSSPTEIAIETEQSDAALIVPTT